MIEPLPKRHSHIGDINELRDKLQEVISVVNEYGSANKERIEEHPGVDEGQSEVGQGKRRGRPRKVEEANSSDSITSGRQE